MNQRIIKFRAWEINWADKDGFEQPQGRMIEWADVLQWQMAQFRKTSYFIWMQYTGLKDVNGKEIYEGDIVRDTQIDKVYGIAWHQELATFCFSDRVALPVGAFPNEHLEIIGNVWESPHLLTNKE